jgi:hypothetical protein
VSPAKAEGLGCGDGWTGAALDGATLAGAGAGGGSPAQPDKLKTNKPLKKRTAKGARAGITPG